MCPFRESKIDDGGIEYVCTKGGEEMLCCNSYRRCFDLEECHYIWEGSQRVGSKPFEYHKRRGHCFWGL